MPVSQQRSQEDQHLIPFFSCTRERWTTNVDPAILKTPFTPEEDRIIVEQWKVHGAKWSIICELLPGRAQTKVRDRFKQLMPMSECTSGYEFDAPFQNVPGRFILSAMMRVVRSLAPTLIDDMLGSQPYFLNPLFQTLQLMHVSLPGAEPDITSNRLAEQRHVHGKIVRIRRPVSAVGKVQHRPRRG